MKLWIAPLGVVAIAITAGAWIFAGGDHENADPIGGPGMTYVVHPLDFDVRIAKDGELAAIDNIDINSTVEGQTTILTLVDEGSAVKQGDVLMTLDSSTITQKIEDTTLDLQKAQADLTTARELKDIQDSQNAANLEAAQVALTLAQLDVKQYQEGTYPQQLANAKTDLDMAQINLKNVEEKLGQTKQLFTKGFVTATAVKDDELSVTTARNAVDKAVTALSVLQDYTHQMDQASKLNALSQAEQKLVRTKHENASNLAQKVADVSAKEQALALLKRRMERYQQQFAGCTIHAPADGLVVYATSGDRNAQNPIQAGATVRERQALMQLPDTSAMKAVIRIQEAQVSRLAPGQRAKVDIVGNSTPIGATLTRISVLADNSQRWWNPDLKEYPVDLALDETPPNLKPGMGCKVEIYLDRATGVLAVPLASLYSAGSDAYVFLPSEEGRFTPRKVVVGRTNETLAEVLDSAGAPALKNGDRVLLLQAGQGQELLERAGIKIAPVPTTRPDNPANRPGGARGNHTPDSTAAPSARSPGHSSVAPKVSSAS